MAITLEQIPSGMTPAYNNIIYVISSTNSGNTNFKYVVDVVIDSDTYRLTLFPHPSFGTAYVNIGKIAESYITSDISIDDYGFQPCLKSYSQIRVNVGEQYGDPIVVYPNLSSNVRRIWNGVIDFLPFQSYDGTGYVIDSGSETKYLTNQPSSITIRDDENAWLYGVTLTSGAIGYAEVITKDVNGSTLQTVNVLNPFPDIDEFDEKKVARFSSGTSNLNSIPTSAITLGSQPIITASVASYDVKWYDLAAGAVTTTQTYTINNECTRNNLYRIHFLNQKGGFDSFTFYRADKKSVRIERSTYKKNAARLTSATTYGYNTDSRTTIPYDTKLTDNISVLSDWINEETSTWLEELITSPEVYLEDATYGLVSIVIQDSTYDFKQEAVDKLFNLRINFRYSYNRYRQRY